MKISILLIITSLLLSLYSCTPPVAVFHGLGDNCSNPGMKSFTEKIGKELNTVAHCFESGAGFLESFEKQCEQACSGIQNNPSFQEEFSVIGLSQGALIARYIIEMCNLKGYATRFVSVGGPQMGVSKFPHCPKNTPFCFLLNSITDTSVYSPEIQKSVGPAGYFRTNKKIEKYIEKSTVLAPLNNESQKSSNKKTRFLLLEKIQLIMFSKDTMIIPKETAWFGYYDENNNTQAVYNSDLYKNDLIGLKTLNEKGKVNFDSINGDHLQFTQKDIEEKMIPYLK